MGDNLYYLIVTPRFLFLCVLLLPFFIYINPVNAQEGNATVIDGDTLDISGQRIRLHGVDAPELNQVCKINNKNWNCGIEASNFLEKLTADHTIVCIRRDTDRYGRSIATCTVGEIDINATLVANGWAIAYRFYSDDYVLDEAIAQKNTLGIWRGKFITPYNWRRGERWE